MQNKTSTATMSTTNYYLMLALVTALVVLAAGYFGQLLVKDSLHNNRVLTSVNKANSQLDQNLTAATALVSNYAQIADTQSLVSNALPKTGDYPGLAALLENAANSAGIQLKSVTAEVSNTSLPAGAVLNGAQPFGFSLEVTGTYAQVTSFLSALHLSARPIQITTLQLGGTSSSMAAQMSGLAYYQADAILPFTTETIK